MAVRDGDGDGRQRHNHGRALRYDFERLPVACTTTICVIRSVINKQINHF